MKPHPHALSPAVLALALATPAAAQFPLTTETGLGMDDAEITHDGKYAIVRENTLSTTFRFYELSSGTLLGEHFAAGVVSGACQDAIALSDTRAVLIGSSTTIVDLTALPAIQVLAEHPTGGFPRDVVITPDGQVAAVRGGSTFSGQIGGLFLFDLATGAQLAHAPGDPTPNPAISVSFDVDSVVASDDYAVFLSYLGPSSDPGTRVTIFDLHPAGGGPPVIALETSAAGPAYDQKGAPHDLALAPDGSFVAVRSELSVAYYDLTGAAPQQSWHKRLWGNPGPFGGSALDSIEVTNDRIATISRWSNGGAGVQLDVFDRSGEQKHDLGLGDPHDLAITPDGARVLVRTSVGLRLYDLVGLPAGNQLTPLDIAPAASTHTSFAAGLDSLVVTDDRAVTLSRVADATDVRIWGLEGDVLDQRALFQMPNPPVDLDLTPNGELVVVSGTEHVLVLDLRTDAVLLDFDPTSGSNQYPWCDGVAVDADHAVAFGYFWPQGGWVTLVDLFQQPTSYCATSPNSAGAGAIAHVTGSASLQSNDLVLWATGVPPGAIATFAYGASQVSLPFGDGLLCVGGTTYRFPAQQASAAGVATQPVDYNGPPSLGGAITAGSTWNVQLQYRDLGGPGGAGFNGSDAVSIDFLP